MIPLSAPSISASVASTGGGAPSASPKGAEAAGFAAMLEATESTADKPGTGGTDLTAALLAAIAGLPDGKSGKAGGKNLPEGEQAVADDLETIEAPDEAGQDQADVPIAAAIPVLPLHVPPLPGVGNPAEFRAAVPDQVPTRATLSRVPAQAVPAAPAAQQAVQKQAVTRSAVPAQVLSIELAPVVTAEAQPAVGGKVGQTPAIVAAAQIASMKPADADAQVPEENSGSLNQTPLVPSSSKDAGAAPASTSFNPSTSSGLRTGGGVADFEHNAPGLIPYSRPTEVIKAQAQVGEPSAAKAPSPTGAPESTVATTSAVAKQDNAEPKPVSADKARLATNVAELDHTTQIAQPVPQHSMAQTAPARIVDVVPAISATQSTPDQPHDFAALVERLSQAREAASPQLVRTALQHAEFGRVSLQFRQDDANLSVTMASADPAFNAAVHSAAAASLAGNAAGQGDRSDNQQQQSHQQPAAPQQQSASAGSGQGQQQSAQARAEQAERMFQRAQGSSARGGQGEAASSGRTDGRRSGIYA